MNTCDHGIPMDMHCAKCMHEGKGARPAAEGNTKEIERLHNELLNSFSRNQALILKYEKEVERREEAWNDLYLDRVKLSEANQRIADLTAQLGQRENDKKLTEGWCTALQECARLLNMRLGSDITNVPKVLAAQLKQHQKGKEMTELEKKIDRALAEIYEALNGADSATEIAMVLKECKTQLEQYQRAEPVAHLTRGNTKRTLTFCGSEDTGAFPVYTKPQPAEPVAVMLPVKERKR